MHKSIEVIFGWCYPLLRRLGLEDTIASYASLVVNIIILSILAYVIFVVFRFILVTLMAIVAKKRKQNLMTY